MKKLLTLLSLSLVFLNIHAQSPILDWAHSFGPYFDTFASAKFHENKCYDLAIDQQGNMYAVGTFSKTTDFDPGAAVFDVSPLYVGTSSLSTFIVKLSAAGNLLWAKSLSTTTQNYYVTSPKITIDKSNNAVITGMYNNTTDFDPSPTGVFNMTGVGGGNDPACYILKLDANGNFIWAKQLGGPNGGEAPWAIRTDKQNCIYTVGTFSDVMDMDPGASVANILPQVSFGTFVSKLDSNGNFIYGKALTGTDLNYTFGLDVYNDKIALAGKFEGTTDFDMSSITNNLTSTNNNSQSFILCLDTALNFQWVHTLVNSDNNTFSAGADVAFNNNGDVHLTGFFSAQKFLGNPINFGTISAPLSKSSDTGRIFIIKFSPTGNILWANTMCYNCNEANIASDARGNVYITGMSQGADSSDFDPTGNNYTVNNGPNGSQAGIAYIKDGYVASYKSSGEIIWAEAISGPYDETPIDIAIGADTSIYIGGHFGTPFTAGLIYNLPDTLDCDPSNAAYNLQSINWNDLFLLKWKQTPAEIPAAVAQITNQAMHLYPNPAGNMLNVTFEKILTGNEKLSLVDVYGKIILTQEIKSSGNSQTHLINIEMLSNGVYTLLFLGDKGNLVAKKFTKLTY
jgi:Secretion system C-terminal sorting domain